MRENDGQKPASRPDEDPFVARLHARDDAAFRQLVRQHHRVMIGLARTFVRNSATAEEVVQDTWLAVISGLSGFEARSSLKSWIFGILVNKARTRAVRDGRTITFTDMSADGEPTVDADRFTPDGSWGDPPGTWTDINPERIVAGRQLLAHVMAILETLPPAQRSIVMLRDVEGLTADEARLVLGVTDANQRVLLHRGRSRIRQALEALLAGSDAGVAAARPTDSADPGSIRGRL